MIVTQTSIVWVCSMSKKKMIFENEVSNILEGNLYT